MPSKSLAQHNLMAAVAHNPEFAKKTGIPQSVGKEFTQADKRKSSESRASQQAVNSPKTNHGASSLFNRGGEVKESKGMMKKEIAFMEKKGAPKSMIKHEKAEAGMGKSKFADGGMPMAPMARRPVDPRMAALAARAAGARPPMAGAMSTRPPMAGAMPTRMAKGGFTKSADGVASKGKTKATQVKMTRGGKC